MLPFSDYNMPVFWNFQQGNAAIHGGNETKKWFQDNSVQVLKCQARSPDLNPHRKPMGVLASKFCKQNRQFKCIHDLGNVTMRLWREMYSPHIEKTIESIYELTVPVLMASGGYTKY